MCKCMCVCLSVTLTMHCCRCLATSVAVKWTSYVVILSCSWNQYRLEYRSMIKAWAWLLFTVTTASMILWLSAVYWVFSTLSSAVSRCRFSVLILVFVLSELLYSSLLDRLLILLRRRLSWILKHPRKLKPFFFFYPPWAGEGMLSIPNSHEVRRRVCLCAHVCEWVLRREEEKLHCDLSLCNLVS